MRSRFVLALAFLFFVMTATSLVKAQTPPTGDENPTANTGVLKAQIETAGSYDAHSGNATRAIPDLRVPGALGVYGLDFVRYYNSLRYDRVQNLHLNPAPEPNQPTDFGAPGWSHSWRWSADVEEYVQEPENEMGEYVYYTLITITFPDGRASKYKIIRYSQWHGSLSPDPRTGPPYYAHRNETNWPGGLHDHLENMAEDGSSFWLYRADGGSVHFTGGPYGYQATQVFDPHGLLTTLHYNNEGNLDWVEQEGGRRLNITWNSGVITRVENAGSGGTQAVEYAYSWFNGWLTLTSAIYQNDPLPGQTVASVYTYQQLVPPEGFVDAGPLVATADDPRFEGPMRFIRYTYRGTGCRPQGQPEPGYPNGQFDYLYASPTAIAAEKSEHVDQSGNPIILSSFSLGCFDGTRTESTGLGVSRKFFYGHSATWPGSGSLGYQLAKLTDFNNGDPTAPGVPFERQSNQNGHPYEVWDGRGIKTRLTHGDGSGLPTEVRHLDSDGSFYLYDRVNPGSSDAPDLTRIPNPYHHWLFSKTDERGLTTTYRRDARRRVTDITHPDGSSEHFTYNFLNQVETHTLPSGAVKHYDYNGSNQLWREWNSVDGVGAATTHTYYGLGNHPEWTGLVATTRNARAAVAGAPYSTMMEYNGRQQVTKVHYPPTSVNPDPYVEYVYDQNGNCIEIWNELRQKSSYTYDDYRRCTSYTEPLHAPDWTGNQDPATFIASRTWTWLYDRWIDGVGQRDAYAHTKNEWRIQIEPAFNAAGDRRMTARAHDLQNRIIIESTGWIQPAGEIGPGNPWYWSADSENHFYSYDENGQKSSFTDPQGRLTTYEYDLRNRLWKINETVNTIPRTTETLYDTTGNKTLVRFPDQRTQQWLDYDPFGQAWTFIDERSNPTNLTYVWGPMKKPYTVTTHRAKDGGGMEDQATTFSYDLVGRPIQLLFADGTDEFSTYEFGQLKTWKTRKNQTKTLVYDARGRELSHSWNDGVTSAIARSWDDANRLTSITNIFSSIDYAYDSAGQVIWEGNEIAGSGGRTQTNYFRYPDGSVAHLYYPGGTYLRKDYTARGQLAAVGWDDDENNWWSKLARYTYMPDGKVDYVEYGNGTTSDRGYNGRGFIDSVLHRFTGSGVLFASHNYTRDTRDRIMTFQKQNGRGDRFLYDDEGQLTDAWYNALDPAGAASGWTRRDHFDYDALGNRQGSNNNVASRNAGTTPVTFSRRDNGLNQYSSWSPSIIYHDDNYPGWGPAGNGVTMAEGWITASYNALNQPVAIWSPTYAGTSNFAWFGFDPLGRCVKRWVGESGDVYSNPATYLHYDGWNLLQEGNNAWGPSRVYAHGNRVDEIVWSYNTFTGQQAFHHYDARTHCTLLTDRSGNVLEQYEYDAFGQPYFFNSTSQPLSSSTVGNRFLFTGREWLSDLRVYDFRHRMYQPELGRFLQPDPKHFAAGDYNLYRYCHNDPVNKSDPTGLLPFEIDTAIQSDFNAARQYLSQDAGMRAGFASAEASNARVIIQGTSGPSGTQAIIGGKEGDRIVVSWNPRTAVVFPSSGNSQSPAMVLGHEVAGHAERMARDIEGARQDTRKPHGDFKNHEEARIITKIESPAAQTLREGVRFKYEGKPYRVDSVLSRNKKDE